MAATAVWTKDQGQVQRKFYSDDSPLASSFYFDNIHHTHAAKVLPGEYYVTNQDIVLVTVLGSCVTACIRDPKLAIGGMNHFMLPDGGQEEGILSHSARYGGFAMELLINELIKSGAKRERLEAKIFGGGHVLSAVTNMQVGNRNADFVCEFLAKEKIPILAKDLIGVHPRKVYYFPRTGRVMVKKLPSQSNDPDNVQEVQYRQRISKQVEKSGSVDLF